MEAKGVVVVGYQGIGKSTLARERSKFVDVESSCFRIGSERPKDWYIYYCNVALHLAEQGRIAFVSSHAEVRNYLNSIPLPESVQIACCVPSVDLEQLWIAKLENRYQTSGLDKDFRALMNAKDRYRSNVLEIMNSFDCRCVIHTIDYKLYDVLFGVFRLQSWYSKDLERIF